MSGWNKWRRKCKKWTPSGVHFYWIKRQSNLVEFGNGFADRTFVQDLFLFHHANQESGGTQAVHLPGDAFGVIVDAGKGIIGEKAACFVAGELDLVVDGIQVIRWPKQSCSALNLVILY